jgi:hypothetical protein
MEGTLYGPIAVEQWLELCSIKNPTNIRIPFEDLIRRRHSESEFVCPVLVILFYFILYLY